MPEPSICPECGSLPSEDRRDPGRDAGCPACGAAAPREPDDWNPYAAPSSASAGMGGERGQMWEVPPSLIGKFALSVRLLGTNLPLFGLILLTVWLPANIAIVYSLSQVDSEQGQAVSFQLNNLVSAVFGPIELGALIFAVAGRMRGNRVGYGEAMAVGLHHWGRLFAARFYAGIRILVGFIALVIPGLVLTVHYSLLEPAIILEQSDDPRRRSIDLTKGRRWPIFIALASCFALDFLGVWASGYIFELVEALNTFWGYVAVNCVQDVVRMPSTILVVLFYLEARQQEATDATSADHGDDPRVDPGRWDVDRPTGAVPEEIAR